MNKDIRLRSYFSRAYNEEIPNRYIVFDLETTGLDPMRDKITEFALLRYVDGKLVDTYTSLVNPKVTIPDIVVEKTNITNEMVNNSPFIEDIIEEMFNFIGNDVIVGHNVYYFDLPFLLNELKNSGKDIDVSEIKYIDTLFLAKRFIKSDTYRLDRLKDMLHLTIDSHRADSDCITCNALLEKCFEEISK